MLGDKFFFVIVVVVSLFERERKSFSSLPFICSSYFNAEVVEGHWTVREFGVAERR